jgi:hypothetical protein
MTHLDHQPTPPTTGRIVSSPSHERPSAVLLAAAFAGLGLVASGCPSDPSAEPDPCPDLTDSVGSASTGSTVSATTNDATTSEPAESSSTGAPATTEDAGSGSTTNPVDPSTTTDGTDTTGTTGDTGEPLGCQPPEVLSEVETKQTFAQYTEDCDALGGYVQITASCSGVNACAGFSVGDWNPDVRSEHTCRGLNGCNGLSCITTPADSGLTGEQILALEAIPNGQPDDVINGPAPCSYCHSVYTDDVLDPSAFKVHVLPGSGRTADNWLDRSPAEMERIVAFGAHGVTADGIAYAAMVGYAKSLSRAEIERVVTHIRTLDPVIQEIKFDEP